MSGYLDIDHINKCIEGHCRGVRVGDLESFSEMRIRLMSGTFFILKRWITCMLIIGIYFFKCEV